MTMIIVVMFTMILTMLFLLDAKVLLMVAVGSLSAIGLSRCAMLRHNWLDGWEEDELVPVEIREDQESEAAPSCWIISRRTARRPGWTSSVWAS